MADPPTVADRADATPASRATVFRLALPIVFANLGVSLSGLADTAVMGRMGAPVYLSATAIGATLFSSLYWTFGFLRMSTGGLVAQAHGARDPDAQRRVTLRALTIAAVLGVLTIALIEPLLAAGLSFMRDADRLHALVGEYVRVRVWSAPQVFMLFVLAGTLIGLQRMRALLAVQLLQTGLNVALNVALFAWTDLDVRGVALATVAADTAALGIAALWLAPLLRGERAGREPLRAWLFDRGELARLFSLSGDLFLRSLCLTFAYFWLTATGTRLGVTVVAVNAILLQFLQFTSFFLDGLAHAGEALVGEAVGRRSRAALLRATRAAAELSLAVAFGLTAVFWALGATFVDLLTTDSGTRAATREWLGWAIALPLLGVGSFLLDGVFVGATRTRPMRDSTFVALLLFVAATWLLVPRFGNHGLWAAFALMLVARAVGLGLALPGLLRHVPDDVRDARAVRPGAAP